MKIEKGRFYKLRNGEKAEIYAVNRKGAYCIHGTICIDDIDDEVRTWREDGQYSNLEHSRDIVSEWVEPKAPRPRMLGYYYNNSASVYLLPSNETAISSLVRAPWLDEPDRL